MFTFNFVAVPDTRNQPAFLPISEQNKRNKKEAQERQEFGNHTPASSPRTRHRRRTTVRRSPGRRRADMTSNRPRTTPVRKPSIMRTELGSKRPTKTPTSRSSTQVVASRSGRGIDGGAQGRARGVAGFGRASRTHQQELPGPQLEIKSASSVGAPAGALTNKRRRGLTQTGILKRYSCQQD
jgi:hypothetical protein